jgi:hypothetical protein
VPIKVRKVRGCNLRNWLVGGARGAAFPTRAGRVGGTRFPARGAGGARLVIGRYPIRGARGAP